MRYRLTVTHSDDSTNILSGLSLEEVLQIVLEESEHDETLWFMLEKMGS